MVVIGIKVPLEWGTTRGESYHRCCERESLKVPLNIMKVKYLTIVEVLEVLQVLFQPGIDIEIDGEKKRSDRKAKPIKRRRSKINERK